MSSTFSCSRSGGLMNKRAWLMIVGITPAIAALFFYGCSADMPGQLVPSGHDGVKSGPCTPGAVSACHQIIGQHDSVVDCYNSTQACTNGLWGPCGGSDG